MAKHLNLESAYADLAGRIEADLIESLQTEHRYTDTQHINLAEFRTSDEQLVRLIKGEVFEQEDLWDDDGSETLWQYEREVIASALTSTLAKFDNEIQALAQKSDEDEDELREQLKEDERFEIGNLDVPPLLEFEYEYHGSVTLSYDLGMPDPGTVSASEMVRLLHRLRITPAALIAAAPAAVIEYTRAHLAVRSGQRHITEGAPDNEYLDEFGAWLEQGIADASTRFGTIFQFSAPPVVDPEKFGAILFRDWDQCPVVFDVGRHFIDGPSRALSRWGEHHPLGCTGFISVESGRLELGGEELPLRSWIEVNLNECTIEDTSRSSKEDAVSLPHFGDQFEAAYSLLLETLYGTKGTPAVRRADLVRGQFRRCASHFDSLPMWACAAIARLFSGANNHRPRRFLRRYLARRSRAPQEATSAAGLRKQMINWVQPSRDAGPPSDAELQWLAGAGANLNCTDENGNTPLMRAVYRLDIEAARKLIGAGAEVAALNPLTKDSALSILGRIMTDAARNFWPRNDCENLVEVQLLDVLLSFNADVMHTPNPAEGNWFANMLGQTGNLQIADRLRVAGMDFGAVCCRGGSLIHHAASRNRLKLVKFLILQNCDPEIRDPIYQHKTVEEILRPLSNEPRSDAAEQAEHEELLALIRARRARKLLLSGPRRRAANAPA